MGILGATLGFSGWVSCFHSNLHIILVYVLRPARCFVSTNPESREFVNLAATSQMVGILSDGHNDSVHAYVGRCAYHHPASVLLIHYVYFIILRFYLVNFILADMLTKTSILNFLLGTTHHPTFFWLFQSRFSGISTPGWAATIACVTPPTALSACFKPISRSSEST